VRTPAPLPSGSETRSLPIQGRLTNVGSVPSVRRLTALQSVNMLAGFDMRLHSYYYCRREEASDRMQRIKRLYAATILMGVVVSGIFFAEFPVRAQQHDPGASSNVVTAPAPALALPAPYISASQIIRHSDPNKLFLRSSVALVMDEREGVILIGRNIDKPRPIASLTKLMTALVVLDTKLSLDETIEITRADRDRLRGTKSRLRYGTVLTRYDALLVAIAASDNRAAAALARTYPGGRTAIISAMNEMARRLGMTTSQFTDASGLHSGNVASARDLARLINATRDYPLIRIMSTSRAFRVTDRRTGSEIAFRNTNSLVWKDSWNIELSKTGYTADAGNCLIMRTTIADRPLVIVLLNSWGKLSKYGDSNRIRKWLLSAERRIQVLAHTATSG